MQRQVYLATDASTYAEYAMICAAMLPELYLLLFPAHFRALLVRWGVGRFSTERAVAFFRSDRFLSWVRTVAGVTLVIYAAALYVVHLHLPSHPKYH